MTIQINVEIHMTKHTYSSVIRAWSLVRPQMCTSGNLNSQWMILQLDLVWREKLLACVMQFVRLCKKGCKKSILEVDHQILWMSDSGDAHSFYREV